MDSKIKGSGEKQKYPRTLTNQQKQTIQTDWSDDCLINKPTTKSKLQQPWRNSKVESSCGPSSRRSGPWPPVDRRADMFPMVHLALVFAFGPAIGK